MPTPDGLIRWYYEKRKEHSARGLDLVKSRGRVYYKRCGAMVLRDGRKVACTSELIHINRHGERVCGRCGSTWRHRERFQLRGEVQESLRGDGFELSMSRWIDVGTLLDRFLGDAVWHWESRLYTANALGRSRKELTVHPPSGFGPASYHRVRTFIEAGRAEWTRRLVGAGIAIDPL